jgi:creatinine amidohydrolase
MRLQDLNWMDVERYLETDQRIMLITGATEQHSYLSLATDILIPSRIALAVVEQEPVLIAPSFNFGVSELFVDFPGTISLSQQTFDSVLIEIVEGLMHQGFERFFILNGHGGNKMPQRLRDLHMDNVIRLDWYNWWRENAALEFAAEHDLRGDHANWSENFTFTRVAEVPAGSKPPVNLEMLDSGQNPRDVLGDGNFGGPYQVDDGLMQGMFVRVVAETVERLRALGES